MRMTRSSLPAALAVCVVLLSATLSIAEARQDLQGMPVSWSAPQELPHLDGYSKRPIATSDSAGNVHCFWNENYGDDQGNEGTSDSIYYSVWDGQAWSTPMDIIATEAVDQAHLQVLDALVDGSGFLHLVWSEASAAFGNHLYWSSVHISQAGQVLSWKTRALETAVIYGADLSLDAGGTIHLVYSTQAARIVYRRSTDSGQTWTQAQDVHAVDIEGEGVDLPKIAVASPEVLHVVWSETSAQDSWNPSGVSYARSNDSGTTWTEPLRLSGPGRHGHPSIVLDGEGRLHIVWLRSVGSADGRYYTWSQDGGASWFGPFPMNYGAGFTAPPSLALDGDSRAHLLNAAERVGGDKAIYHSVWQGNSWAVPQPIPGSFGEAAYLVIRGGNELLAIWHNEGDLYSSRATIDARIVPLEPVPTFSPGESGTDQEATATPQSPTPVASETPEDMPEMARTPQVVESPGAPSAGGLSLLLVGIAPCVLLIALVAIVRLTRRHR